LHSASIHRPSNQVRKSGPRLQPLPRSGIAKRRFNLTTMAYDVCILYQVRHFNVAPIGDNIWIKPLKDFEKPFSAAQDGNPA
tara:strand:- start:103 stop:348 length:246 start_codon:yes stop_codon:yes gene_type:complete